MTDTIVPTTSPDATTISSVEETVINGDIVTTVTEIKTVCDIFS
jgi:hypothetical protein